VQAQLTALLEAAGELCYREALERIGDLREDPTPSDAMLLRSARDYYRIYLCRNRWRLIYRVFFRRKSAQRMRCAR
jgi:hypothetical protein